jgi:sterol desaturase/sphingolipid hydroxylase (fatty acid hydroxylase superfamily)
MEIHFTPTTWRGLASIGGLLLFMAVESVVPFRQWISRLRHVAVNLLFLGVNAAVSLLFSGLLMGYALFLKTEQIGLLHRFPIGGAWNLFCSLILLDLFTYLFHVACHRIDFLWRFHRVHHTDREVDVTTASRFHPGEVLTALFFKMVWITPLGVDPFSLLVFEGILLFAAQFVHGNFKIPDRGDGRVRMLFVTPDMHRIHHSDCPRQTNSNYANLFSFWDRLFKTAQTGSQCDILLGLKDYTDPGDLTVKRLFLMPFDPDRRMNHNKKGSGY